MKHLAIFGLVVFLTTSLAAQPIFNVGLKAGLNNSKVTLDVDQINSESILSYHVGAFGRLGAGKIFVQPEAYFSSKGGELKGSALEVASKFDFNTVDIPLLLGIKVIDGERANVRLMGGPVFSFLTSKDIEGDVLLDPEYYKNNYVALQYGVGADFLGFTLDLRMENSGDIYTHKTNSGWNGKNNTFMVSVGYKIF